MHAHDTATLMGWRGVKINSERSDTCILAKVVEECGHLHACTSSEVTLSVASVKHLLPRGNFEGGEDARAMTRRRSMVCKQHCGYYWSLQNARLLSRSLACSAPRTVWMGHPNFTKRMGGGMGRDGSSACTLRGREARCRSRGGEACSRYTQQACVWAWQVRLRGGVAGYHACRHEREKSGGTHAYGEPLGVRTVVRCGCNPWRYHGVKLVDCVIFLFRSLRKF